MHPSNLPELPRTRDTFCRRCFSSSAAFIGKDLSHILAAHAECDRPAAVSLLSEAQKSRKKRAAKFSKRRTTFLKKANELSKECEDIDVYVEVRNRRSNQVWIYSNGYAPLTREQRAHTYPRPIEMNPNSFQREDQEISSKD
ncbi:hypothetical protein FSARC_11367 [Fusarium sarcochroum]|uniref:MADS-box domain-containing protein n=1 Tax=Fusarium sarcochroum TaxID=1208366 RepID=A0A8H4TFZ1_9HYPO|nr:hypothetical protein FSARC_11367 [Fusarium sarcochroum]